MNLQEIKTQLLKEIEACITTINDKKAQWDGLKAKLKQLDKLSQAGSAQHPSQRIDLTPTNMIGDKVQDKLTGFKGTVVQIITPPPREVEGILTQPEDVFLVENESQQIWFDESRLEVLE